MPEVENRFVNSIPLSVWTHSMGMGETLDQMLKESCGRIGAVFLEGFHIAPAGVFINGGILIELFTFCLIDQTTGRNKLYIDLYPLSGVFHLLIRLGGHTWD